MNLADRKSFTGPLLVLVLFVATAATLRYAQDFSSRWCSRDC